MDKERTNERRRQFLAGVGGLATAAGCVAFALMPFACRDKKRDDKKEVKQPIKKDYKDGFVTLKYPDGSVAIAGDCENAYGEKSDINLTINNDSAHSAFKFTPSPDFDVIYNFDLTTADAPVSADIYDRRTSDHVTYDVKSPATNAIRFQIGEMQSNPDSIDVEGVKKIAGLALNNFDEWQARRAFDDEDAEEKFSGQLVDIANLGNGIVTMKYSDGSVGVVAIYNKSPGPDTTYLRMDGSNAKLDVIPDDKFSVSYNFDLRDATVPVILTVCDRQTLEKGKYVVDTPEIAKIRENIATMVNCKGNHKLVDLNLFKTISETVVNSFDAKQARAEISEQNPRLKSNLVKKLKIR